MIGACYPWIRTMLLVAACAALGAACTFDNGHPPVARATATPSAIPENDGFQTTVVLDGTASADPLDDPDNTFPLALEWKISRDEFRFEDGTETSATPTLTFRGDRPATIQLTVTDADGQTGTVSFELQLTVTL